MYNKKCVFCLISHFFLFFPFILFKKAHQKELYLHSSLNLSALTLVKKLLNLLIYKNELKGLIKYMRKMYFKKKFHAPLR